MALADALTAGVPAHELSAALHLWAAGLITRQQALDGAKVPAHAEADVDALAAVWQGKSSQVAKLEYVVRLEKVAMLLQGGTINPGQFSTLMELG